ncbi:CDP-glucose 4,6-dehydratase [Paenibacillus thiaminolyticus]|uniref:CDP-glucose 4,6-dehydratase n=1 Tax=Paenibacillus thiaminolyticus TaxID=49283 RepID=UPI00232D9466|nr:CDP-glucose 4,6-dehydratase [Paenibacillus thiaminolyticus]WCF05658.1 CDP-glucose 4,6-dehydratase [Paenibacillus thiaminolyticus]
MGSTSFWSNRKVLITGHTGFKGTWLALWLHTLGADVTGYALLPSGEPNLFRLCGLDHLIRSVIADIREQEALLCTIQEVQPEVIIHLAAQPLVRYSYLEPVHTYEVNVLGTVHLLEAVRIATAAKTPIKAVLNVTSDKCYEDQEWFWGYREIDKLGGYDPYSSSKACAELVTASYRNSYFNRKDYDVHGVSIATARAGNVIGGGDGSEDRIVPDCMRAILAESKLLIRNPAATRPWQHVLEPLQGYLLLAQKMVERGPEVAEAWNFGPMEDSVKSVEWLVKRIGKLYGNDDFYELAAGEHPHETANLGLDSSKSRRVLGWKPVWNVEQALEKTVEWFTAYQNKKDMKSVCLQQLTAYTIARDREMISCEGGEM